MWKADTNINFYKNLLEQKENGQIKAIEFNFSTICLLCLKNLLKNQSTLNLLSSEVNISAEISQLNASSNSDSITIKEMLLEVMANKHEHFDDNFPQQICAKCLDCLRKSYFFKSRTLKTLNVLERLLLASRKSVHNDSEQENKIQRKSIDLEPSYDFEDKPPKMDNDMTLSTSVDNSDFKFIAGNNQQIVQKLKINKIENENLQNLETKDAEVIEYLEYSNPFEDVEVEVEDEDIFIENGSMNYEFIESEVDESDNENMDDVEKEFREGQLLNNQPSISTVAKFPHKSADEITSSVLKIPKSIEKIESIFQCPGCEAVLGSKNNLRNHIIKKHPNSKYFKCDECDRCFRTWQSLQRHLKCHQNNIERKMCNYCSKSFLRADDLRRHERVHTNERPFACQWPSCNKSFKQSSELRTHLSVHLKTEYKCNLCDKIFRSRYGIYAHKKKTHLKAP